MYRLLIVLLTLGLSISEDTTNTQDTKLKVSLYYECLCPDCLQFVSQQLYPTYKTDIGSHLNLDLVPFGNAKAYNDNGNWKFTCQHGPRECFGNKIQSCALADFPNESSSFVGCLMSMSDPTYDLCIKKCADQSSIPYENLIGCITSGRSDELLALNGAKTKRVQPPIRSVPTIIFNDKYDEELQREAQEDFRGTVCKLLQNIPQDCRGNDNAIEVNVV